MMRREVESMSGISTLFENIHPVPIHKLDTRAILEYADVGDDDSIVAIWEQHFKCGVQLTDEEKEAYLPRRHSRRGRKSLIYPFLVYLQSLIVFFNNPVLTLGYDTICAMTEMSEGHLCNMWPKLVCLGLVERLAHIPQRGPGVRDAAPKRINVKLLTLFLETYKDSEFAFAMDQMHRFVYTDAEIGEFIRSMKPILTAKAKENHLKYLDWKAKVTEESEAVLAIQAEKEAVAKAVSRNSLGRKLEEATIGTSGREWLDKARHVLVMHNKNRVKSLVHDYNYFVEKKQFLSQVYEDYMREKTGCIDADNTEPYFNMRYLDDGISRFYNNACRTKNEKHSASERMNYMSAFLGPNAFIPGGWDVNGSIYRLAYAIRNGAQLPYDIDIYELIFSLCDLEDTLPEGLTFRMVRPLFKYELLRMYMRDWDKIFRLLTHDKAFREFMDATFERDKAIALEAIDNDSTLSSKERRAKKDRLNRLFAELNIVDTFGLDLDTFWTKLRNGVYEFLGHPDTHGKLERGHIFIHESNVHIELMYRLYLRGILAGNVYDCFYFDPSDISVKEFEELYYEVVDWYCAWLTNLKQEKDEEARLREISRLENKEKRTRKAVSAFARDIRLAFGVGTKDDLKYARTITTRKKNKAQKELQEEIIRRENTELAKARREVMEAKSEFEKTAPKHSNIISYSKEFISAMVAYGSDMAKSILARGAKVWDDYRERKLLTALQHGLSYHRRGGLALLEFDSM